MTPARSWDHPKPQLTHPSIDYATALTRTELRDITREIVSGAFNGCLRFAWYEVGIR
jgi:hypothetical protein